ncbi:MAG TPA: hypothetical protein DF712_13040 [Balneola sp.]|nr:hypothetical protein [Bacteroidota bacterium]MAC04098.1 hypothetical protein [Balneola sp.]MAO78105.1 hypothetical protein [Balneola sp.]MBF64106.1 hypothetical protein [Balneola sp.]HAH51329.1 hypothetical protein [Balneola sp.]
MGASLWACSSNIKKQQQPTTTEVKADSSDFKIAYNVAYDLDADNYEIFVMNADGTEQRNISNSPGVDWVYYAYKDRLYFVSDRDSTSRKYFLYEMKWDGTEIRKVTDFLVHDSWMSSRKNGTEFVLSINKGDDYDTRDLYIINLKGEIIRQLTDDNFQNTDAHFSPDGTQIAFRSNRSKYDELYIMNDDGTGIRQLTDYPSNDSTALEWEYHAGPPQWIDSNQISYLSKQNSNYSIFSISPLGTNYKQLTPDSTSNGYLSNEGWHSWSRDNKYIAFNATNMVGNYDIYIMKSDITGLKRLTRTQWYAQAPVFVYPED